MAKTKISISLIRNGLEENSIVKDGTASINLPNGMKLYYKEAPASQPKWVKSFFNDVISEDMFKTKSLSALILYKIEVEENEYRYFAITFGYGRNLLNNNVVEERFGLLVTLNVVDSNHLRSIDVNSLESIPLNNRIQSSALAGINNFNIDIDRDLLKSVAGKSSTEGFDGTLSGTDTLSISSDKQYNNIYDFLKECYQQFISVKYKENFDWIDQMNVVKDVSLIAELDQKMIDNLNSEAPSMMWISIPEIIDWTGDNMIRVKKNLYDDIDIADLKTTYNNVPFTIEVLKSQRISIMDDLGNMQKSWPLYRCMYVDLKCDEKQYLLNDGKWFIINNDFVSIVNDYYNNATIFMDDLPDYDVKDEKEYNQKIEDSNREIYHLMDRKLIPLGGGKIEFCDIYSNHKKFIHIKNYKSSAVLSHLFFQGVVSAEAFFDQEFRKEVQSKMKQDFMIPQENPIIPSNYEVVYIIAKKNANAKSLPDIPFFSKVSYRNASKRLQRYGYKVSITAVPYTYIATDIQENE